MTPSEIFWLAYVLPGLLAALGILLFARYCDDPISNWPQDEKEYMFFLFIWPVGVVLAIMGGFMWVFSTIMNSTTKEITFRKKTK